MPPLSAYSSQFLLYYWTYTTFYQESFSALDTLHGLICQDADNLPQFVKSSLSWHADYARHLLEKIVLVLRDERVMDDAARRVLYLAGLFVLNDAKAFLQVELPEGSGLLPSIIISCHRQICSGSLSEAPLFVHLVVQTLV